MAQRVRQIELTLERWRWLPAFDTPPIIVNIPQFRLFAFRTTEDRFVDILQMPVIVGQAYPRSRTPVFVGEMKYIIFRPYWDVPRSITVREMLPEIHTHADYLQRNNLEIVRGQSDAATVMSPTSATIAALAAGQLRLRQRPGDDNALGLIKFAFPNAHDVYLHSTPARRLFLQSRRAFSHGCIRVSDPIALAAYVLRNNAGGWDEEKIGTAMRANNSARVNLAQPIRVMVLYGTAMATEAGPIQFFDDIYGHDRKLEALLDLRPVHGARSAH
jgi:murein L,D-transpeptidase YcbB/YkuD